MPESKTVTTIRAEDQDNTPTGDKRLLSFIERIERLEEEKAELAEDIKDIYTEAKAAGFDTKTMKKVIKLRAMDREKRQEEQYLLETYAKAVQLELF